MTAERTVTLINKLGLHVRPAAKIAEIASKYQSEVTINKDAQQANAKSIMELLTLGAPCGTSLVIRANGPDEEISVREIEQIITAKFGEE